MSGLMGPPPSAGPSRGKRRASSDSSASISDYASAEEDDLGGCGEGKKARIAPSSASTATAGSHHFDAYVHEGDENSRIFVRMVEQAGMRLSAGKARISLDSPASVFVNKVRNFVKRKLKEVTVTMRTAEDEARARQEFEESVIDGLQMYMEDPLRLHKALVGTEFVKEGKCVEQESLVKMILKCEDLQTCLAKTIMEKMVEVSSVAGASTVMDVIERGVGVRVNIGQLILHQLQGLNTVADGRALVEIMKDHFEYLNQADQKQFIVAAPFILLDNDHEEMANYFLQVLEKEAMKKDYLTVPILDSFSNFLLTPSLNEAAMEKVFSIIPSMSFQEIPAAVKFLMESVNSVEGGTASVGIVEEILKQLRRNLDLNSDVGPNNASSATSTTTTTQSTKRRKIADEEANKKSSVALILDAMLNGIRMERVVWQAWNQLIHNLVVGASSRSTTTRQALDLDLVVLILLCHHEPSRPAAEKTLKKAVKSGFLTTTIVKSVFKHHAAVLSQYLKAIVRITNTLIQSAHQDSNILSFLNTLVGEIFASFDEKSQQEIVYLLVVAIGNGNPAQKDTAIDTLTHLIKLHVKKVEQFSVMIKSLLDHLESFSLSQARRLFSMLGAIAAASTSGREESTLDDIHIIITKQLSSSEFHYKSLAIVGGVSLVWHSKNFQNSAEKLLDTLMTSCWADPRAFALLCDELSMTLKFESEMTLSAAIANASLDAGPGAGEIFSQTQTRQATTHKKLIDHLYEVVCDLFQNEFCAEDSTSEDAGSSRKGAAATTMDRNLCYQVPLNEAETSLHIPLLEMITKGFVGLRNRLPVEASILSPLFRLLCLLVKRKSEALEEIDAVLICPVSLPAEAVHLRFGELSVEKKNVVLAAWFHCANWFRELLNGFSADDQGCQKSMGHRLRALTHLEMLLLQALNSHVKFEAPLATFDVADKTLKPPKVSVGSVAGKGKKSTKTAKKMTKKKPKGEETRSEDLGDSDEENKTTNNNNNKTKNMDDDKGDVGKEKKNLLCDLSHYKAAFRELDIEVFNLLIRKCELTEDHGGDPPSNGQYMVLKPKELLFLLEELVLKLAFKLPAPSTFGGFPGRTPNVSIHRNLEMTQANKVWKKVTKLIPFICNHMEDISAYYQEPAAKSKAQLENPNDSLFTQTAFVDSVDRFTDDGLAIRSSFKHLMSCINSVFGWSESSAPDNRSSLQEALENIACKIAAGASTAASTQKAASEALEGTFRYFTNYAESIPSIECAVELIKILKNISGFAPRPSLRKRFEEKISLLCKQFLCKEWLGPDRQKIKGLQRLKDLEFITDNCISQSPDEITVAEELTTQGLGDVVTCLTSMGKADSAPAASKTFASIDKASFPVVFRSVLKSLASLARDTHVRFNEDVISVDEVIDEWTLSTRILHQNFSFLRTFDPARIAVACIRHGHAFLEVFLKQALPLFTKNFHEKSQPIMSLLKTLQQVTRVMNHLCGHSKYEKDRNLLRFVPKLRRTLEAFVCQVKVLMTSNRCSEAMWMGNLKNRNLQGQEILSQSTTVDEEESRADDTEECEDLPNLDKPKSEREGEEDEDNDEDEEEDEDDDDEDDTTRDANSLSDVF